jgi:16S rRNA G966 N2-methylase RsmD
VTSLTIVEKDPVMYEFIRKTAASLGMDKSTIVKMDVFRFIDQCSSSFDLIFAGPPYALTNIDDIPRKVFEKNLLNLVDG